MFVSMFIVNQMDVCVYHKDGQKYANLFKELYK
jgi:hypothetical protein